MLGVRQRRAGKRARGSSRLTKASPGSTLEKLTGTRQMDAAAITEYFGPLLELAGRTEQGQDLRLVEVQVMSDVMGEAEADAAH